MKRAYLLLVLLTGFTLLHAGKKDLAIRCNQVGMDPSGEKVFVFDGYASRPTITVKRLGADGKWNVIQCFPAVRASVSPWSGKTRYVADISSLDTEGRYQVSSKGVKADFVIKDNPLHDVALAALKAFYLIRSGMDIDETYAGKWHRKGGHPDTLVFVHPSAESPLRPAGTEISSPKGWYDAGDYNKYVVNSSFAIGLVLSCYEQNTGYFATLDTNIPESGNTSPDILDEMMYNLEWLLSMQDPYDGGVYHKLTTPYFEGFVMPDECKQQRYVVKKTTTAALDFAAVMAKAARIYLANPEYPGFSSRACAAAVKAYEWARHNPDSWYNQSEMNKYFKPEITTGEYDDMQSDDELFWASTELYLLTGKNEYLEVAEKYMPNKFVTPDWKDVSSLGVYDWVSRHDGNRLTAKACALLKAYADNLVADIPTSCFQSTYGNRPENFYWGCLAECCCQTISLLYADQYIQKGKYRKAAFGNADYLLGRNPLGYCYVTGFGSKSPMHPHHRISEADGIAEPFPGLLVGGPNPGQEDRESSKLTYPSLWPDESYVDNMGSYASNEIALNWNASLVAMLCWLDAIGK